MYHPLIGKLLVLDKASSTSESTVSNVQQNEHNIAS